jgi:hypothetical protein
MTVLIREADGRVSRRVYLDGILRPKFSDQRILECLAGSTPAQIFRPASSAPVLARVRRTRQPNLPDGRAGQPYLGIRCMVTCCGMPVSLPTMATTRAIYAYLGHRNAQNTSRYTALAPQQFREFFRD